MTQSIFIRSKKLVDSTTIVRKLTFIILVTLAWNSSAQENTNKLYENALIAFQNNEIEISIIHLKMP